MEVYRMHLYNEGSEEREGVAETSGVPFPLTRPTGTLSPGERGRVRGALKGEEVVKMFG